MRKKKLAIEDKTKKTIQEEIKTIGARDILCGVILVLLPIVSFFLYEFVFIYDWMLQLPKLCFLLFYGLAFFYLFITSLKKKTFAYYIRVHLYRFVIVFAICTFIAILQTQYTYLLWLYFPICVILTMLSDMQTAIGSFFYLLFLQALISDMEPMFFLSAALIGVITIILFGNLDESFCFAMPFAVSALFQAMLSLLLYFALNKTITFDALLFTAIQLFVGFIIVSLFLKILSHFILHKDRDRFQELNDPEYVLLTELKKRNPKEYYHAIHTAYFCEKIAKKIGANDMLAKAGGYYHKIGRLRGDKNLKNILEIAHEHGFPPVLLELLKEYCGKNTPPRSKEVAIVIFADAMVSSVMFLFENDKNAKLDYERIVNVVFQKQLESGMLKHCDITMEELTIMQRIFVEENIYYDFLR